MMLRGVGMVKEKEISKKLLFKSGFWYMVSNYLTRAMVFITMPIFTRLMTKEQYGDFSVFANLQAIFIIICGLENYSTINRARFDFTDNGEFDGYITSSLTLSTIFTGIIFILYMIFPYIFDRVFLLDRRYIFVMFAYLFAFPAFAMFQAKQRIEYKYKINSLISVFLSIFSATISTVFVIYYTSDRVMGRILGQYVPYVVAGLIFYVYFLQCSHSISIKAWKYAVRMGVPMVFGFLGGQVLLSSNILVVKQMCSAEAVSYLSVTLTCNHIILLLVQTLNGAWAPWFYDMLKLDNIKIIRETFLFFLWSVVICTFVVIMIGPEIILMLGGRAYIESRDILPAYILCGVFTVLTAQFANLEAYNKKPEYSAVFTMLAAVLNIFLGIIGVKLIGYQAVCYTTVICQLFLITLHYCAVLKMGIRKLLPLKSMLIPLVVSLSFIPIAFMLYRLDTIRYICMVLIFILAGIGVANKRQKIGKMLYTLWS